MFLVVNQTTWNVVNDRQSSHNTSVKYKEKRLAAAAAQDGGIAANYALIPVPPAEEADAMAAIYITYTGSGFVYYTGNRYLVENGVITVRKQWIKGSTLLEADDSTDFTSLSEDTHFALDAYADNATGAISIELFLWGDTEDKGDGPIGKTYCHTVCSGVYHFATQTFTFD